MSAIENGDIADLVLLLWYCIKSVCNADGEGFDASFELFADTLDAEVLQDFIAGLTTQSEDDTQKKARRSRSNSGH